MLSPSIRTSTNIIIIGGAAVPPVTALLFTVINHTHTHAHACGGGLTAALIASLNCCNISSSFSEMIIGENPWLLSEVHYIMPASQSASRPPLTPPPRLYTVTAGSDFFFFLLQILTMSTTHESLYSCICPQQERPTPPVSPTSPEVRM